MEPLKPSDPEEVGGITLRGRLGQGGMGTVYFGVTADGDRVAVKMIRDDLIKHSLVRERFDREILALGMVQGPRVAALVAAASEDESSPWFAAEFVQGVTLSDYVQAIGTLPAAMGAALGIMLAQALTEIHEAGLLHRDLKPANIVLGEDGPKVIDFGLVALTEATGHLTHSSALLGTPVCMAPEQINTPKNLTSAVDVYALGAVMLFAHTAHYAYQMPTMPALLHAIADPATEPDLSGLPEEMTSILGNLLTHDPAARPYLDEIVADLTAVLADAGMSVLEGQRQLAELTYIERDSDPPAVVDPPRPRWMRMPKDPYVPGQLVHRISEKLRHEYALTGKF